MHLHQLHVPQEAFGVFNSDKVYASISNPRYNQQMYLTGHNENCISTGGFEIENKGTQPDHSGAVGVLCNNSSRVYCNGNE